MPEAVQNNLIRILKNLVEYGKPVSKTRMGFELDRGAFLCRQWEMDALVALDYVTKTPDWKYTPTALGIEAAGTKKPMAPSVKSESPFQRTNMTPKFIEAAKNLIEATEQFKAGAIKSLRYRDQRAAALSAALTELAGGFGVVLQQPLQINANGEFSIVCIPDESKPHFPGCDLFGEGFAMMLNDYSPRTGVAPGATMIPQNGWCWMNHFDVEKMVMNQYAKLTAPVDGEALDSPVKPKKMRP